MPGPDGLVAPVGFRYPSADGTDCQWYDTGGEWVCREVPTYQVRLSMSPAVAARYLASGPKWLGGPEVKESDTWILMWFCTAHAASWRQEHHDAVAARAAEGLPPYVYSDYTIASWPR